MLSFNPDILSTASGKNSTLHSIFCRISFGAKKSDRVLVARSLSSAGIVDDSRHLPADSLQEDFARLNRLHPEAQPETYLYLLQKHGWRVGDPSKSEEEIQTAALCDTVRVQTALENPGENGDYLLVKGDLSGIQNYIYGGIQPKNAGGQAKLSKRLRGRSALVSMLTDFLANAVLHELDFPNEHLLFAGGGHFNLLLPYSEKLESELDMLSEKIGTEMRRAFGDTLDLVVVSIRCDPSIRENAGAFFDRLNIKREAKKYQQHTKSLPEYFYPKNELPVVEKNLQKTKRDKLTEDLGTMLPKRHLLIETISSVEILPRENREFEVIHFQLYNAHHQLFLADSEKEWDKIEDMLLVNDSKIKSARVFTMNDTQIFPAEKEWGSQLKMPVSFGFRFIGKHAPKNADGAPQTFEELASPDGAMTNEEKKGGILGSLRLDVDDLGCIFSNGLGKNTALTQIVALSREMHYFFTAHFDYLASERGIYVIYSGGDDAFAVGRWDKIIGFASQLHIDFQKFVQKNEDMHFSAGIFMGDPKYPVERFFRDAGLLLKEAKVPKNKVNVFSRNLSWPSFKSKIDFGTELFEALKKPDVKAKRKLTMAFMYRILQLVKSSFHERSGIDESGYKVKRGYVDLAKFGRNVASIRYLFARHGYTSDEISDITQGVEHKLTTDFLTTFNFGSNNKDSQTKTARVQDFLVAFNYALFCLRFHKKLNQSQHG